MSLLEAINLKKAFGGRTVVNGVSLEVEHSEIVGLLGRNGAGNPWPSSGTSVLGTQTDCATEF